MNNEENTGTGLGTLLDKSAAVPVADESPTAAADTQVAPQVQDITPIEPTIKSVMSANPRTPRIEKPNDQSTKLSRLENSLHTLPANSDQLNEVSANYSAVDISRGEEQKHWLYSINEAYKTIPAARAFIDSVNRDESLWAQAVTSGAEKISVGSPQFAEGVAPGDRLTGERAVMRIQSLLKLGQVVRAPMWHTGVWLTFKAPSEAALLELERRIAGEKVILGRQTMGLVFSNTSIYINSYLVNFALSHVIDATVRYKDVEELKSILRINDIPLLIWGLLCTIYPSGYPHVQPCVKDPAKCTHLVEDVISIGKLLWTDERALTERQRRHMTDRTKKYNPNELEFYQEDHRSMSLGVVNAKPGLDIELKVPTVLEFEQAGFEWVDGIVTATDQAFGGTMKGEERNEYIMQSSQTSALRQYAHYIKRVVLNSNEIIEDRQTIEDTISVLTSDDEVYEKFFNGVGKFINDSTISLIALPKFDCPACGPEDEVSQEEKQKQLAHPYLIPLDVVSVFFTLLGQRLIKILSR